MFVEARARVQPEVGAAWIEIGGTYAMFDGPDSPLTQTFGLGLFDPPTADQLEAIEGFFEALGAPTNHEVSTLAPVVLLEMLNVRGYRPIELSTVLFQPLTPGAIPSPNPRIAARVIGPNESDLWIRTTIDGWSESPEFAPYFETLGPVVAARDRSALFLAEIGGRPVAAGGITFHAGVALLAGAATIPSARKQGAQNTLLAARLAFALAEGCDIAMMATAPGSASQRNAERRGFRVGYTRTKWCRPRGAADS